MEVDSELWDISLHNMNNRRITEHINCSVIVTSIFQVAIPINRGVIKYSKFKNDCKDIATIFYRRVPLIEVEPELLPPGIVPLNNVIETNFSPAMFHFQHEKARLQ